MADFNFYVNRQGIRGRKGEQGEQGFSPIVSVKTQTANEYVLTVQNEDGSFDTPNLRGNAIANTGGTYIRYNQETGEMYTGYADNASYNNAGEVQFATYAQLENGGAEQLGVTSIDVYEFVHSVARQSGLSFSDLANTLVAGSNITLAVDSENEIITINSSVDMSNIPSLSGDNTYTGVQTYYTRSGSTANTIHEAIRIPMSNGGTILIGRNSRDQALIAATGQRLRIGTTDPSRPAVDFYQESTTYFPSIVMASVASDNVNYGDDTQDLHYPLFNALNFHAGNGLSITYTGDGDAKQYTISASEAGKVYFVNTSSNTIYADITAALAADKLCVCNYMNATYIYSNTEYESYSSMNVHVFRAIQDYNTLGYIRIYEDNTLLRSEGNSLAETDLANLSTDGNKRLHALKGYLDELEPLKDIEGYTDYVNNLYSTFDRSKFTVTGSPTITDDGIASGIGKTNYLETNVTYADIKNKSWTFKTGAYIDHTNVAFILFDNSYQTLGSVLYNNGLKLCANFGDSTESTGEIYVASLGVVPIGWYDISLNFDINTGTYTLWAKNIDTNAEYTNNYTPTVANKQLYILNTKSESTVLRIGNTKASATQTIDLKQFSITVDGVEVFSGNKTGIDTIKPDDYTVVGTPTISDDGIISSITSSNRITIPSGYTAPDYSKGFEFQCRCKTPVEAPAGYHALIYTQGFIGTVGSNFQYRDDANNKYITDISFNLNTWYDIKVGYNAETKKNYFAIRPSGTTSWSITESTAIESYTNRSATDIGGIGNNNGNYLWDGEIDLNSYKLYSAGSLYYQPCLKIPYIETRQNDRIADVVYISRCQDAYNQYGNCNEVVLDQTNQVYYLPAGSIYGKINGLNNLISDISTILNSINGETI